MASGSEYLLGRHGLPHIWDIYLGKCKVPSQVCYFRNSLWTLRIPLTSCNFIFYLQGETVNNLHCTAWLPNNSGFSALRKMNRKLSFCFLKKKKNPCSSQLGVVEIALAGSGEHLPEEIRWREVRVGEPAWSAKMLEFFLLQTNYCLHGQPGKVRIESPDSYRVGSFFLRKRLCLFAFKKELKMLRAFWVTHTSLMYL